MTSSSPTQLGFVTNATTTTAGASISQIQVAIQDGTGTTVTSSSATVTLAIVPNPGSAALYGTATIAAVNGIASFPTFFLYKQPQPDTLFKPLLLALPYQARLLIFYPLRLHSSPFSTTEQYC